MLQKNNNKDFEILRKFNYNDITNLKLSLIPMICNVILLRNLTVKFAQFEI